MTTKAEISDLGYKRYAGPRRAQSSRWRVIMRHQIAQGWRGVWRYKLALGLAIVATAISAMLMWVYEDKAVGLFGGDAAQRLADSVVPFATATFCKFGLLVSMTLSASAISDDVASGAFTFYFARSTRPIDYVVGKFAGLFVLMLPIMLGGPLLLAFVQLALTPDNRSIVDALGVIPRTIGVGILGSLVYSAIPLGFSAMAKGRMLALGSWAIYYIILGQIGGALAMFVSGPLGAIDLAGDLMQVSLHLAGLSLKMLDVPTWAALTGILVPVVVALAVALLRVQRAADAGVGGSS